VSPAPRIGRRAALGASLALASLPAAGAEAPESVDVLIIGAGLSGLTAASRLAARHRSVVVLEAQDRVGGRTYHGPVGTGRFDLGAQFVGPTQDRVRALAAELGLALKPVFTQGKRIWELRDTTLEFGQGTPPLPIVTLFDLPRVLGKMDALAAYVGASAPWASQDAAALDAQTVAGWTAAHSFTANTADLVTCATRAVFGADPDELSMLFLAFYAAQGDSIEMLSNTAGGAQDSVIVGGTQQMALRLAEGLGGAVRLNQPVRLVRQSEAGVEVLSETGATFGARRLIMAMPPSAAARVTFDPPLPPDRRDLQQRAPMGRYYKVVITYETPFWRAAGYSGEVASVLGPITALYDDDPGDGTGALLAFIGGDHALKWCALPHDLQRSQVLRCLGRWFGSRALLPTGYGFEDWSAQRFTGGAPVAIMAPGVLSRVGPALRAPCDLIHWAGTEAAEKWTGYMDGAIRAGEAAAKDVDERLAF
jgi:monoamine oxidase